MISSFQEEKTLWHFLRQHTLSKWRELIVGVFACTKIVACMELAPSHSRMVNRESRQCYLSKLLFEKKILPSLQYAHRMFFALFPGFQDQWKRFAVNKRVGKHFSFQQQKRKRTFLKISPNLTLTLHKYGNRYLYEEDRDRVIWTWQFFWGRPWCSCREGGRWPGTWCWAFSRNMINIQFPVHIQDKGLRQIEGYIRLIKELQCTQC